MIIYLFSMTFIKVKKITLSLILKREGRRLSRLGMSPLISSWHSYYINDDLYSFIKIVFTFYRCMNYYLYMKIKCFYIKRLFFLSGLFFAISIITMEKQEETVMISQPRSLSQAALVTIAKEKARDIHNKKTTIAQIIQDLFGKKPRLPLQFQESLLKEIGRQYYLLYGDPTRAYEKRYLYVGMMMEYGFSVAELLKHGKLPPVSSDGVLDLHQLRINSLDGLALIPHKNNIIELNLNDNQIGLLTNGLFVDFTSLRYLSIKENRLVTIDSLAFKGLDTLLSLDLSFNKLVSLSDNLLSNLRTLPLLESLNLSDNGIDEKEQKKIRTIFKVRVLFSPKDRWRRVL